MAKNNTAKKVQKKTGPNEKIPVQSGFGMVKSILIGVVVGIIIIVCLMSGYFDKYLYGQDSVNIAKDATATPSVTSKIPVNLPPKITAPPKNAPKATNIKGPNEPGYRVSGGETSTGEKGWIKEVVTPGNFFFFFLFIFFK